MMLTPTYSHSVTYGESSYEYDDNSSLDSGIERSFENNYPFNSHVDIPRTPRKRHYRNSKVTIEEFKALEKEFQPTLGSQTSTPIKPKRKYAQGKSRISRSQSPTQIIKIRKYRRIKVGKFLQRMKTLGFEEVKFEKIFRKCLDSLQKRKFDDV